MTNPVSESLAGRFCPSWALELRTTSSEKLDTLKAAGAGGWIPEGTQVAKVPRIY